MTLIITELSTAGIAMAADSAITHFHSGKIERISEAKKIYSIPYLNAGISIHGVWEIDRLPANEWVQQFIVANNGHLISLKSFADGLALNLNAHFPANDKGEERLGFHLAGYEELNGELKPSFYHIHDGVSSVLAGRGIHVDGRIFNANHDLTPEIFHEQALLSEQRGYDFIYQTRNGDISLYVPAFESLGAFFQSIARFGIHIPGTRGLAHRLEFLRFQIETMEQIYNLSNLSNTIGGTISGLMILPDEASQEYSWPVRSEI